MKARVTDRLPGAGKALVQCGDVVYSCDAAVLCSGDLPGKGLPQPAGSPAHLPSAWQYDDIARIPSTASVAVIGLDGTASTPVYFVGPLTRGVHFHTNSVETLRTNSTATARSVLRGLG